MLSRPVGDCRTTTAPLARRRLFLVVRTVVGVGLRTFGAYEEGRKDDRPCAYVGSGGAGSPLAVRTLGLGDAHTDHEAVEIDVTTAEAGQFLGSHRATGTEVDRELPPDADRVGKGVDLADGGDAPLCRRLLARTLDPARVASDQVIIDSRLKDAFEKAVLLGDPSLGSGGPEAFGTPLAYTSRRDLVRVESAECREDVQS